MFDLPKRLQTVAKNVEALGPASISAYLLQAATELNAHRDRIAQQDAVIAGLGDAVLSAATALPVLRDMCHHAKLRIGAERAADMIDEIAAALAKAKESQPSAGEPIDPVGVANQTE